MLAAQNAWNAAETSNTVGTSTDGEIGGRVDALHKQAECVAEMVARLEARLGSVTRQRPAAEQSERQEPMPVMHTPLGNRLFAIEGSLDKSYKRLSVLIDRIDI